MAKDTYTTGLGTLVYPKLVTPDAKFVKSEKDKAKFKTSFEFAAPADLEKFKAAVIAFAKGQRFDTKKPAMPWKALTDKEGNDTDRIVISASRPWRPLIVDAKNRKIADSDSIPNDFKVGGGSKGRISVEFYAYDKGVSLRLQAVQITELVKGGDDSPFGAEEGYEFGEDEGNESPFGGSSDASESTDGPDI